METQTHELIAAAKEATDREQRLQLTLSALASEKSAGQRELDDLKQANGKLAEDHAMFRKVHDSELAGLRKNLTSGEVEKVALQRKVDELTSQNQEMAKALAGRLKDEGDIPMRDIGSEPEDFSLDRSEPEHSPPPSPTKGASRHTMLESETLKSSLHHAHRMIQNLKSNIHREKTEKVELKRVLQEARDELEQRRGEQGATANASKRLKRGSQPDLSKKNVRSGVLGAGRNSRTDITIDEAGWEENNGEDVSEHVGPSRLPGLDSGNGARAHTDLSDAYQTANETEDAFETASERDTTTENEAFQTGAESMAGDSSDELTETEGSVARGGTIREKRPSRLPTARAGDRSSFISTASTSADENDYEPNTPIQTYPQRYRLKINRGSRRSRIGSEGLTNSNPSSLKNSPASFISTGGQNGQSLFTELGELTGDDSGGEAHGTPSKASIISRRSTSSSRPSISEHGVLPSVEAPVPRLPMVDSAMMTEDMDANAEGQGAANEISQTVLPATPRSRDFGVQRTPASGPRFISTSTSMSTSPRPAWDQPWGNFVGTIPTFGPVLTTTPKSATSTSLRDAEVNNTPGSLQADSAASPLPVMSSHFESQQPASDLSQTLTPSAPVTLTLSPIQSLETNPVEPSVTFTAHDERLPSDHQVSPASGTSVDASKGSIFGSVLGWTRSKRHSVPQIVEDETSRDFANQSASEGSKMPFQEVPANVMRRIADIADTAGSMDKADQSSQTTLSAEQIESLMNSNNSKRLRHPSEADQRPPSSSMMRPLADIGAVSPVLQRGQSQESMKSNSRTPSRVVEPAGVREENPPSKTLKRPSSSGSVRATYSPYPPLPPDHRQAIAAAAAQRAPVPEDPSAVMGPPMAPASAYRSASNRMRAPSEQRIVSPVSKNSATPRARYSTARSQVSRRSSVSSFVSELDERFNIRSDGMPMPQGFDSGTDPRMIQAITQTMIGEFLWKYTRKAGRGEMSDNRHRRFFWVHPYTRTLYWSDRDPSTAGRAEMKAKSVAIEAVRVVTDDNPMPPGLHRKSLVIITPGRAVKFTAATSQRHETWFNALSYLLSRTGPDGSALDGNNLTAEDVEEFNPPSYSRRRTGSRLSLASYSSRAGRTPSRNASFERAQSSLSAQHQPPAAPNSTSSRHSLQPPPNQGSLSSRISSYWRPHRNSTAQGSISSLRSRSGAHGASSIYEANGEHDSAEDLRQVIERQEQEADRLENVRACCDGKLHSVNILHNSFVSGNNVYSLDYRET